MNDYLIALVQHGNHFVKFPQLGTNLMNPSENLYFSIHRVDIHLYTDGAVFAFRPELIE
jgi:hypothetical protein